ncbi:unnamed protein product, partial [Ectocarpus sp. 6 AP-2014]
ADGGPTPRTVPCHVRAPYHAAAGAQPLLRGGGAGHGLRGRRGRFPGLPGLDDRHLSARDAERLPHQASRHHSDGPGPHPVPWQRRQRLHIPVRLG